MNILPKDYVIVVQNDTRSIVKVAEDSGKGRWLGLIENPKGEDKSIAFKSKEVVANLGSSPKVGSVYGMNVEPMVSKKQDSRFGEIRHFTRFGEKEHATVLEGIDKFWKRVTKLGHTGSIRFNMEIRNPKGKVAGFYKHFPKLDTDLMCIRPDVEELDLLDYVLSHEFAHAVYYRRCNAKTHSRWAKLYHEFIKRTSISVEELDYMLEAVHTEGSLLGYIKTLEDDDKKAMSCVLKHIQQVHGLGKHHLENALVAHDTLDDYWPETVIEYSDKEVVISSYARKSPEEFFAEAYAHWYLGRPLPDDIQKLLDSTLAKLTR